MEKVKENIETLLKKAAEAETADAAMKFSQAAVNAANAVCAWNHREPKK